MRVKMKDGSVKELTPCYAMRLIERGKAVPAPKPAKSKAKEGTKNGL